MAAEIQSPDAVVSSSGLDVSGGVSVIQDDPDSPDANWFTSTGSNGSLRVSFPTPTGDPTTGAGIQEFRVQLRKDATGGGDPTYVAELRETGGGAALQTLATDVAVTSASGQVESLTWDAANLGTADGSAVELLLTLSKGGGGPNERNVEVGAVEWNVEYTAGGQEFQQSAPAVVSASAGLTRSTATAKAATVAASTSITKDVSVTRAANATGAAALQRSTAKTLSAVTSNVAAQTASKILLQLCAAVTSCVAGLTTAITFGQLCAAGASAVAGLSKRTAKALSATATAPATITKRVGKALAATTANVADMSPSLVFLQECAATANAVAGLSVTVAWTQLCAATASVLAEIRKATSKTFSGVASVVASLDTGQAGGGVGRVRTAFLQAAAIVHVRRGRGRR